MLKNDQCLNNNESPTYGCEEIIMVLLLALESYHKFIKKQLNKLTNRYKEEIKSFREWNLGLNSFKLTTL